MEICLGEIQVGERTKHWYLTGLRAGFTTELLSPPYRMEEAAQSIRFLMRPIGVSLKAHGDLEKTSKLP